MTQVATMTNSFCISALEKFSLIWNTPWLPASVSIVFSPRLRKRLGCYSPGKKEIRLNMLLLSQDNEGLLLQVLCHEAAHVVNHERNGTTLKPHGPEWRTLVAEAGYTPSTSIEINTPGTPGMNRRTKIRYEYRCPVCQNVQYANKPMPGWRCGDCLAAGLGGELIAVKKIEVKNE